MRNSRYLSAIVTLVLGFLARPAVAQDPTIGYWDPRFEPAALGGLGFQRLVEAMAVDPVSGDVFVGGGNLLRFTGEPIVRWTGSDWASVGGSFNNAVNAIAFGPDGTLYAGGNFTSIDGSPAGRVARLEGGTWIPLGNGVNGAVYALAVDPATGHLYVGGDFTEAEQADGTPLPTRDLVKWTGSEWERVGQGGDGHRIDALAFDPISGDLFVGGSLNPGLRNSDSTLVSIGYLGRFDGDSWVDLEDPSFRIFLVNAIAFDPEGQLYVAHNIDGGLAFWDRTDWAMPAGGLGYIQPNGVRTGDDGTSIAVGDGRVYVGGGFTYVTQPDGSTITARGVVAYDPEIDRFEALGEGVHRSSTATHIVAALLARPDGSGGDELFVGGTFTDAGARPAANIARWTSTAPFPAAEVTFRTDLRTPMRLGLFGGLSFLYPTARRPMVDVLSSDPPERYVLFDPDGDSVWTARITLPKNVAIDYAYAMEFSGTGFERGTDWIYELGAPDGETRSAALGNALLHTLPVVPFDDMPLRSVDPGYEHRVDRYFDAGNPGEIRYPAGGSSGVVRIDPEILDRPMNVAVRWYQKDPGGAAPDGIVAVAKSAYWSIAHIPRAADHSSAMWFDYGEIPGVVEPNDLRLLYRPTATSPWQVIPADVDANALEIRTAGVTALAGDWTVGTVSSANPLSTDPPAMVSSPTPTDGALAAAIRPLFRWSGGPDAATFDLYIWPSTAAEPTGPTRSGLQTPQVQLTDDLEFGETYHWRVLAHNINGETPGPVWTFTVGPVPDLTVTSLTGPETGFSGQEVVVGWTVTNMGGGGTNVPAWYDEVYLSASADFQRNLATRIGRSRNLSFLNPGESYLGSLAFVLPDGIEGVRYLHVVSDDSDLMAEADESNNVASKGLSVTLSPYADLEVEGLIVPSDVFSGDSIDVTFTVSNVGDGRTSATSWVDSIFLSDDEVFDYNFTSSESVLRVNERLVGTSEHIGALEPGESYSTTTRIRLPDDAIGDRYVFVYTDIPGGSKQSIGGEVYEFNQDLDNWTGRAIAITLTPPPDLVVTSVVPPPAAQSGERVDLSWTVENRGPGGTRATRWRDVAYISETPEFDALQAVVLGLHEHIGSLEPDEQYVRSARITVPDGFEGAGYFFIETDVDARVFEFTFETNNMGGASAPVSVTRAPYPDLQVSGIDVSTSSAVAGDELAVSYTVSNHGTAPVDRTRVDSVYVVPGHVWDPGVARRVAAFTQTAPLGIGESRTETVAVTIPDDVEGTVHLFVRPDARNDVFEYPDLVNNVAGNGPVVVAPYPTADLAAAFSVAPEPAHTGEMVPLSLSVTNVGEGRTRVAEWNDRVYLSADEALDPAVDRLLLSSRHTGSLSSGEGYAISGVHLPDDVPGDWYLIVLVDSEGILAESYEMNNRANVPLTVALSTPSDLRVTDLEAPESVHAGQTAVIAWTVHNDGSGATRSSASSGGWFDSVYLSPDGRLDGNDLLLGTIERSPGLESGASYQTSLSVPVPASASGPNVFLVRSDDRGDVYEHLAEGNNTSAKLSSVSLPEPSDLVVDSVAVPAGASPGELVSISWTLVNRGAHPAQGLIREAAFLSTDDSWDIADPAVGVAEREIHLEPGAQASVALKVDASRSLVLDSHGAVSGLLPGAAPGAYHVIVRTDIAGAIRETDVANNLRASESTIQVAVPDLTPGIPAVVSLDAGGSRTFRLQVDGDQDLRLTLSSAGGMGSNELYVARDRVPVPGGLFDHAAASPFTADQKLLIPSAEAGTYFVLALTRSLSADGVSEDLTLLAETLGFSVESITPAVGGQGQVTSVVTGAGFRPSARILLRSGSGAEFEGRIIDEARSTERRVRWQLATTPVGIYDVVVVNEAGGEAVLPGGFRVEPATRLAIDTQVAAPDAIRQGSSATYGLTFRNNGNTDIPYLLIEAATSFARDIDIIASAGLLTLTDMLPDAFNPAGHDFVYSQEKMASIPMLYRNLPPGGSATASMTFKSPEDPLLLSLYANPLTAPQYVGQLRSHFATLREQIMLHRDDVDPFFVGLAGDREEFDRRYFRVYVALGILEPEEGIGLPDGLLVAGKRSFGSTSPTAENGDDDSCLIFYQDGSVAEFWPCPPDPPPLPPTPPAPPPTPEPTPEPGPNPPGACGSYDRCLEIKARQCGYAGVLHCAALGGLAGILTVGAGGIVLGGLCSALYVNACDTSNPNSLPRSICTPVKQSCDPNDIIGPDGFGAAKWIRRDATLTYTVRFENDPLKATAPAQVVGITHPLAETADVRRFRLGTFGFGPFSFHPPANAAHYSTRLDVTDSLGVYVDVTAGLDVIGNRAFWVFRSVDPETGDQPSNDPFAGFLPVNDDTGAGEGFAEYSIAPAENAATGDRLNALARIIFDINPPLDTPEVFNTIDATPPVSSVAVQPGRQDTTAFHVSWSGTDEGSGIRDFELNVSTDEGPFVRYQEATSGTSLLFIAEKDRTYRFFTIATDNVGNREAMKTEGEAVTVVGVEEEAPGLPASFALHQNYPNPFNPRTTIPFDIAQHADVQIIVYNVLGQRVLVARDEPMSPGHYQQTIDMSTFASGVYFYEIRVMGSGKARFRDVRKLVLVK